MRQKWRESLNSPENAKNSPQTPKKTFRYVPRSINQMNSRPKPQITQSEAKKRITRPRQPQQEPPIPSYLGKNKNNNRNISRPSTAKQNQKERKQGDDDILLNDASLIALREHLFETGDVENCDDEKLKLMLEHLREFSSFSAIQREYDDAEKSNELQEKIKDELKMRNSNVPQVRECLGGYEELLEEQQKKFQKELEEYDKQTNEKKENLEEKQKKELDEFEEHWRNDMPRKYRKPSTKLITCYEIERKLGMNGEWKKAKKLKQETEILQAQEMQQAQLQLIKDYNKAKSKLLQNQREEYQVFVSAREHNRDVIIARQKVERSYIDNRGNVLVQKQNESLKTKESVFDPTAGSNANVAGAAILHREASKQSGHLLPPLLPPNDDRIKDMLAKENEQQKQRNKKFAKYRREKELEADNSEASFSSTSTSRSFDPILGSSRSSSQSTSRKHYSNRPQTAIRQRSKPSTPHSKRSTNSNISGSYGRSNQKKQNETLLSPSSISTSTSTSESDEEPKLPSETNSHSLDNILNNGNLTSPNQTQATTSENEPAKVTTEPKQEENDESKKEDNIESKQGENIENKTEENIESKQSETIERKLDENIENNTEQNLDQKPDENIYQNQGKATEQKMETEEKQEQSSSSSSSRSTHKSKETNPESNVNNNTQEKEEKNQTAPQNSQDLNANKQELQASNVNEDENNDKPAEPTKANNTETFNLTQTDRFKE